MKLLIICAILSVAVAQETVLRCDYYVGGGLYICDLTLNNPNGFDNFTEIAGNHLEGFGNNDVNYLARFVVNSPNIPSIICNTFPNLLYVYLYSSGLTEIGNDDFDGCSSINTLNLQSNRINSVGENAFDNLVNLTALMLYNNAISNWPANLFSSQANLRQLDIGANNVNELPANLFQPLVNLEYLFLDYLNLTSINSQWFANTGNLANLILDGNRIVLAENSFAGLENLRYLSLAANGISEVFVPAFTRLTNLRELSLSDNNINVLEENTFNGMPELLSYLVLDYNPIDVIHDGAFRGLENLDSLVLQRAQIRQLHSNSFEGLNSLEYLNLNFNDLDELPVGVFSSLSNATYIGLWNNRLKSLHRNRFGVLSRLQTIDLDGNVVNALDRSIFEDATNLNILYFDRNLCASGWFGSFSLNRDLYMVALDRCFFNMRYIVDVVTDADAQYSFFDAPQPGIAFRARTENEIQIALTPFDFPWRPMLEIIIGAENNTISIIRRNQETDVVTRPTPNILSLDQWNDFRVTWEEQVILVYREGSRFPFMAYTMEDFYNVNFYGLRAVETSATWSVQPFAWDDVAVPLNAPTTNGEKETHTFRNAEQLRKTLWSPLK